MPDTEKNKETELVEVELDAETLFLLDSDSATFPDLTSLLDECPTVFHR